jgi:multicomponent K+:H+ antiporter subunit A
LNLLLPSILLLPFAGSLLMAFLPNRARDAGAWLAGGVALAAAGLAVACWPAMAAGEVLRWRVEWLPEHGLDFALRMDGLAWLFTAIVSGIGALIVLYARYYLSPEDRRRASTRSCSRSWARCWAWCSPATWSCWWCSGSSPA